MNLKIDMSPFDFVNDINYKKTDLLKNDDDGSLEKKYTPFIVNKALSYFIDTVLFANEMNQRHHIDSKLQYHYLLNTIRKKSRFSKWMRPEIIEKINLISEYYGCSVEKAKQVQSIITDEDILFIKDKLRKGGMKEE